MLCFSLHLLPSFLTFLYSHTGFLYVLWVCWVLFHLQAFTPAVSFAGNASLLCMISFFHPWDPALTSPPQRSLSCPFYIISFLYKELHTLFPSLLELITICNYSSYWLLLLLLLGPVLPWIARAKGLSHSSVTSGAGPVPGTPFHQYLLNQWMDPQAIQ